MIHSNVGDGLHEFRTQAEHRDKAAHVLLADGSSSTHLFSSPAARFCFCSGQKAELSGRTLYCLVICRHASRDARSRLCQSDSSPLD